MCIRGRVFMALICLGAVAMLAGCGGGGSDRDGRVAFTSGANIDVVNGDGTNQHVLVTNASQPSLSRDSRVVAFVRSNAIFVQNTNGTGLTQVASTIELETYSDPAISPNKQQVLYVETSGMTSDIHIVDVDGTNDSVVVSDGIEPAWNPNGTQIAFVRGADIFTINTDGSGLTNMTNNAAGTVASNPSFNGDGSLVAFESVSTAPGAIPSIKTVATSDLTVSDVVANGTNPAFNPDENEIAFVRDGQILKTDENGTDVVTLTTGTADDDPSWSR